MSSNMFDQLRLGPDQPSLTRDHLPSPGDADFEQADEEGNFRHHHHPQVNAALRRLRKGTYGTGLYAEHDVEVSHVRCYYSQVLDNPDFVPPEQAFDAPLNDADGDRPPSRPYGSYGRTQYPEGYYDSDDASDPFGEVYNCFSPPPPNERFGNGDAYDDAPISVSSQSPELGFANASADSPFPFRPDGTWASPSNDPFEDARRADAHSEPSIDSAFSERDSPFPLRHDGTWASPSNDRYAAVPFPRSVDHAIPPYGQPRLHLEVDHASCALEAISPLSLGPAAMPVPKDPLRGTPGLLSADFDDPNVVSPCSTPRYAIASPVRGPLRVMNPDPPASSPVYIPASPRVYYPPTSPAFERRALARPRGESIFASPAEGWEWECAQREADALVGQQERAALADSGWEAFLFPGEGAPASPPGLSGWRGTWCPPDEDDDEGW